MRKSAILMLALLLVTTAAVAQHEGQPPDPAAMQAAMEKAAKVGPQHEWLQSMAGDWNVTAKFWMDPSGDPIVTQGKAKRSVMHDGRVLSETFTGEFMGQAFSGYGLSGYDNVTQKYWSTWTDTMSTGLMLMSGTCKDDHSCVYEGTHEDPLMGTMTMKFVSKHSADEETHEAFMTPKGGPEVKGMELHYKRAK